MSYTQQALKRVDALIERHCYDQTVWECKDGTGDWLIRGQDGEDYIIPRYSQDMMHAWPLAERYGIQVSPSLIEGWVVTEFKGVTGDGKRYGFPETTTEAPTAPLAICLCALKVVERQRGKPTTVPDGRTPLLFWESVQASESTEAG